MRLTRAVDDPHVGFKIHDRTGTVIFETNTYCMRRRIGRMEAGLLRVVFTFPCRLVWGDYTLTIGVGEHGTQPRRLRTPVLLYAAHVAIFTVARNADDIVWNGLINLEPEAVIERQGEA